MCKSAIVCLAIVASFSQVLAQTATPQTCAQATGISFNQNAFSGQWIELARNPASTVSCITLNVAFWQNTNMLVNVSHTSNAASTLVDVYENANITLVENNSAGYNVTLVNGQKKEYVFVKLLSYVNSTYLVGCTYTDASNVSTSAGFILGRSSYTPEGVKTANNDAALSFSNFQANTYGNVTQFGCRASSAGQTVPLTLISGFLALALLLIKA
ncbi:uncharacterized protein LOC6553066 [Drosophila erecta]|uniref:GG16940 n=1 Tax=Drosophila erecta TaxID=7220 RepID=B3P3T7_DROER|nr:uncharacterized protein LOC6553066 [Drosophila erecta]EDV49043.1 uncharacterized protein Dere_GG16940 [Drosophila erecta]